MEFLTEEETAALVAAPDPATWIGRRDKALLLVAVQTGLRNSEITSLRHQDVEFGTGAHVRCLGKGRKMRCTPLRPDVAAVLKEWLSQQGGAAADPVFPSSNGGRLSADAFQRLVSRHIKTACRTCPSLTAEEGDAPHPATRGRHGPAASRCGSQRDRSLARPRIDRNDPDLPARRHAAKGTRARPRDFFRPRTRPLPAAGPAARLLGEPVIMPTNRPPKIRDPSRPTLSRIPTRHNPGVGITSVTAARGSADVVIERSAGFSQKQRQCLSSASADM